jgi:hypothetical protein
MENKALTAALARAGFDERYYALCERYPAGPKRRGVSATKDDVAAALRTAGVRYTYDPRDRSFRIDPRQVNGLDWHGLFVKQQGGALDLILHGEAPDAPSYTAGGSFALLAEQVARSRGAAAGGSARYPRPSYNNDPELLRAIACDFVRLYRECLEAIAASEGSFALVEPDRLPAFCAAPFSWAALR